MNKDKKIQIRIAEKDMNELQQIAAELDRPMSQLIREGVRKEIRNLKRKSPKRDVAFQN